MYNLEMGSDFYNFYLSPSSLLNSVHFQTLEDSYINTSLRIGLEVDFYSNTRYLFTTSLQYMQGFGKLQTNNIVLYYTKYDENSMESEHIYHTTEIFSKGSALQLTLSRRFQLYPWIPLSKKKRIANEEGL